MFGIAAGFMTGVCKKVCMCLCGGRPSVVRMLHFLSELSRSESTGAREEQGIELTPSGT